MAESAALLVDEVLPEQPIRQWVLSFPFQLRFLFASRPQLMGRVLGIVYRALSAQLIQKAGFTRKRAQTGAVTLIQRFGSALNLNVHFHMLFLDGVYTITPWGKSRFHRTNAPDQRELTELVHTISQRVAGFLEREGILEIDEENSYLNLDDADEDPMQQVLGCSVSYRIAVGPQQGRKVFTLQTIPSWEDDDRFSQVAKASGFSLHAGVAAQAWERSKLERLCRYISRPAVSEKRLSLTSSGNIRYDVNGFTSVAGAWMRRSDSAQNALQRWDHACHLRTAGFHVAHPCAPPFGRPAVVQIGYPANLSLPSWRRWSRSRE
jgi:hypothetical protein